MTGRLTNEDMDTLEQWIGKGPKTFTLLYAITQDACDAAMFHQKCDNKGPTVTVLYNQQDSVYGGYTSASWNSSGSYVQTTDSFMFQLKYSGTKTANMFNLKQDHYQYSIYCHTNYGPTFGAGHDLLTYQGTVQNAGGYFSLNGYMKRFGRSYDNRGIAADKINNKTMNVTELEVYRVANGQRKKQDVVPWRKTKAWNEKLLDELTEEIVAFMAPEDVRVTVVRILMVGPIGSGKSSFYNTINSAFRGRITHRARSGSAQQSLTTTYTPYTVNVRSGAALNFRLCDTRGLEESSSITDVELNYLLDGNIPDYYQFNPSVPFSQKTQGFKSNPTPNDEVHCAAIVLDSTTLDILSSKVVDKIKRFQDIMNHKGIPQFVLLTKIDKLCKEVERDVSSVFKSETVGKLVEKAAQLLGLPRLNVLPVKNYENEEEVDEHVNILALLAVRKMLHSTEDYFCNLLQQNKDVQTGIEKLNLEK